MSAIRHPWRSAAALLLFAATLTAVAVTAIRHLGPAPTQARIAGSGPDLAHPDLLIRTRALSGLPTDLVKAPLLRDVLSEDLVGYYAEHPGLLSLDGSLRRLAYEHQLNFAERLLSQALDAPAELALWRNGRGQPDHFVLILEHTLTSRAIYELGRVALPDNQISKAGELLGGTPLYALRLGPRATWLLASRGDRAVLLSEPTLALDPDGGLTATGRQRIEALLDPDREVSAFAETFGLRVLDPTARHDITAGIGLLTWGYEHFMPGLEALRLRVGEDRVWSAAVRVSTDAAAHWRSGARALWSALPHDSALCAVLPFLPAAAAPIVRAAFDSADKQWLESLAPGAAVCWNAIGGLFAPGFAAPLSATRPADLDRRLGAAFELALRGPAAGQAHESGDEPGNQSEAPSADQARRGETKGADAESEEVQTDEAQTAATDDRDGRRAAQRTNERTEQAASAESGATLTAPRRRALPELITSAFEHQPARLDAQLPAPADNHLWLAAVPDARGGRRQGAARGHAVALVRLEARLWASTDVRALSPALAVAAGTWPAMTDEDGALAAADAAGPAEAVPVLALDGPQLARLLEAATWASLNPRRTPTFHRVARALLPERLRAVAALGRLRVMLQGPGPRGADASAGPGWQALAVRQLPARTLAAGAPLEAPSPTLRVLP